MTETNWRDLKPMDIEHRSFEIIGTELAQRGITGIPEEQLPVVKRVIHTSADFDYAQNLYFSPDAVKHGLTAIANGAHVVTDTKMAWSGINKNMLAKFGGDAVCYVSDSDVEAKAKELGITRAAVSMDKACSVPDPLIIAVGNAPTALLRLRELLDEGKIKPALVIGVPVGFVNVVESKEEIISSEVPCIVARGRKGGSNVAACIVNALMYEAAKQRDLSRVTS